MGFAASDSCFGTTALTRDGRNEVRAVYGGFGLAIGLLLLATLSLAGMRAGVFLTVGVALLGMAAGRLISSILDGSPGFFPWLFTGTELVLSGILIYLLQSVA